MGLWVRFAELEYLHSDLPEESCSLSGTWAANGISGCYPIMEYRITHSETPSCHVAYMLSFHDYIYHLAYWYKHVVDWHRSADFIFKSTDLDNTRIPSHTFWKTSLPFHILLMWWPLKIPVNKYIETWTKLVPTWSSCSLNKCFKIKPFLPYPLPRYITALLLS